MVVTLEMSKLSGWLNADAPRNISAMSVTLEVTKLSGWLNANAFANIPDMAVTLEVSRLSGWLNATADRNISAMSVTLEVSQLERGSLNSRMPSKRLLMSVMAETSQSPMRPHFSMAAILSML